MLRFAVIMSFALLSVVLAFPTDDEAVEPSRVPRSAHHGCDDPFGGGRGGFGGLGGGAAAGAEAEASAGAGSSGGFGSPLGASGSNAQASANAGSQAFGRK